MLSFQLVISHYFNVVGVARPVPVEDLCHDPEVWKEYTEDKLVHPYMTFLTGDSLTKAGEYLQGNPGLFNPSNVPLLILFGSVDVVCDPKAAEKFFNDISTTDKTFKLFDGMKHELHNEPRVKKEEIQFYLDWILERAK